MTINWDSRIDNALMNAEALISSIEASDDPEDSHLLASAWMALAELWLRRQSNEADYEVWRSETEFEDA